MNTSIISILKASCFNMEGMKMSLNDIVDDLEITYDALGGVPMARHMLYNMAQVWCEESLTQRISENVECATGAW